MRSRPLSRLQVLLLGGFLCAPGLVAQEEVPADPSGSPALAIPVQALLDLPPGQAAPAPAPKSASDDFDAGPVVTLRCVGGNGVFDLGPESDDLICTAPVTDDPTPSVLVVRYRFPGVKPMFQRCRFVRGTPPADLNCP